MSDHNYEATAEVDGVTFTFSGDQPMTVAAQAARMPAIYQYKYRIRGLDVPREEILEEEL